MHAYADPEPSARDRAFEHLYRRYAKDVYRYTLAVLRNPADAEDITQTTFLNAYRAFKRGEDPRKPQNWLIKIAHNACRTRYLRASRRPQEVPLEESLSDLAIPGDEIPNVKEVLDALAKLPFNQRAALVMRELEGRSYAEIAEALDVSVSAVETLIFRARRSLRVRRAALRTLAALPLPGSLSSFSGGTAAVGGATLLGSGLVLKGVFAVSVGILAGGVGTGVQARIFSSDHTVAARDKPALTASPARGSATTSRFAAVRKPRVAGVEGWSRAPREHPRGTADPRPERAPDAPGGGSTDSPTVATSADGASGSAGTPAASPPSPVPVATETVQKVVPEPPVTLPSLPSVPDLPAPPVALPPPPALPPIAPPALPPPPPLPPPPSLP